MKLAYDSTDEKKDHQTKMDMIQDRQTHAKNKPVDLRRPKALGGVSFDYNPSPREGKEGRKGEQKMGRKRKGQRAGQLSK
jgi:hypothetical protein